MLIVLGKNRKGNNGDTKMNFSGVASTKITGTKLVEYTNKDLHTHSNNSNNTNYIDHTPSNTRKVVRDVFVVNADSTR